jgi:hypothetical protein
MLTEGKSKGPIKTIFTGTKIVDTVFFQGTGELVNKNVSGYLGKPLTPAEPSSEVVININTNPQTIKYITNLTLETFIPVFYQKTANFNNGLFIFLPILHN